MKAIKIILSWLVFLGIIAAIVLLLVLHFKVPVLPTLPGYQVIIFALSIAFMWVEVLKIGRVKPFNCLKCLTGWVALIMAFMFHLEPWPLYLPVGLFVGAMFEGIKMRWL